MLRNLFLRMLVVAGALVILGSCGGGGGGGFRVFFDTKSLEFTYIEGELPTGKVVTAVAEGNPPASGIYVGAMVSGEGIQQPISIDIDYSTAKAYSHIRPMSGLMPGVYTGKISLLACKDELCRRHVAGSPHDVAYKINVITKLKATPSMALFSVVEQGAVSPQTLHLALPDGVSSANTSVVYGLGAQDWLQVSTNGSEVTLLPVLTGLAEGSYTAQLVLALEAPAQTLSVPVVITVSRDPLLHLRADKDRLDIAGLEGKVLPAKMVTVGVSPASAGFTAAVQYQGDASGWLQVQKTGSELTLTPSTVGLGPGVYTATLQLADMSSSETLAIPVELIVAYDIMEHLRVDQAAMSFSGVETELVSAKTLEVGLPPVATGLSHALTYGAGGSGWLRVQSVANGLVLTPETTGLLPGIYAVDLLLRATGTSESLVVPVTFTVGNGLLPLPDELVVVDMNATGTGGFVVQALPATTVTQWTASSDKEWLVVETASGAMGDQLRWRLDPVLFGELANNTDHVAMVRVAGQGYSGVFKKVTFRKRFREIVRIDTLALIPGRGGDVLLYGTGFASIQEFSRKLVLSEGLVPEQVVVMSDRMAVIRLPAMPAGNHEISLSAEMGSSTRKHVLRIVDQVAYPYQAVPTVGSKTSLLWDPVTRSAFGLEKAAGFLHRFAWNGTAFVHDMAGVASPFTMGMSRDHQNLMVLDSMGDLHHFNPSTLQPGVKTKVTTAVGGSHMAGVFPMMVLGDGTLRFPSPAAFFDVNNWMQFNPDTGALSAIGGGLSDDFVRGPFGVVSADGRRGMVSRGSSNYPLMTIDMSEGYYRTYEGESLPMEFQQLATDRKGGKWLMDNLEVYDSWLALQGSISWPQGWLFWNSVVSRDGSRAYVYAIDDASFDYWFGEYPTEAKPRIYVYDLSPLPTRVTNFPLLGYFEFDDYASCRGGTGCVAVPRMAIAQDDKTLFLLGDRNFVALPVPAQYLPGEPVAPSMPAGVVGHAIGQRPLEMRYWRFR